MPPCPAFIFFFFFNDTATTEIYTLSLHDALPILPVRDPDRLARATRRRGRARRCGGTRAARARPRVGRRHVRLVHEPRGAPPHRRRGARRDRRPLAAPCAGRGPAPPAGSPRASRAERRPAP